MCAAHSSAQAQPAGQPRAPPPAPRREAPQVARSPPANSATNHQQGALALDNGLAVASQPPAAGPPSQPAAMPPQPSGAAVVRLGRTPVPPKHPQSGRKAAEAKPGCTYSGSFCVGDSPFKGMLCITFRHFLCACADVYERHLSLGGRHQHVLLHEGQINGWHQRLCPATSHRVSGWLAGRQC